MLAGRLPYGLSVGPCGCGGPVTWNAHLAAARATDCATGRRSTGPLKAPEPTPGRAFLGRYGWPTGYPAQPLGCTCGRCCAHSGPVSPKPALASPALEFAAFRPGKPAASCRPKLVPPAPDDYSALAIGALLCARLMLHETCVCVCKLHAICICCSPARPKFRPSSPGFRGGSARAHSDVSCDPSTVPLLAPSRLALSRSAQVLPSRLTPVHINQPKRPIDTRTHACTPDR